MIDRFRPRFFNVKMNMIAFFWIKKKPEIESKYMKIIHRLIKTKTCTGRVGFQDFFFFLKSPSTHLFLSLIRKKNLGWTVFRLFVALILETQTVKFNQRSHSSNVLRPFLVLSFLWICFTCNRLKPRVLCFFLFFCRWRFRRPTLPPPPPLLPPPPPPPPPRRERRATRRAKGGLDGRSTSGRWNSSSSAPCRPEKLLLLLPVLLLWPWFPLSGVWEPCCLLWWDAEVPCSTGPAAKNSSHWETERAPRPSTVRLYVPHNK